MVFKPMAKKKEKGKQGKTGQVQVSVRFPDVTILPDIKESRKESVAATMLDKRYSCCGVHVKTLADIIGWFGVITSIINLTMAILGIGRNFWEFIAEPIAIVVYFTLILAYKKTHPYWYLPFLIVNVFVIIIKIIYIAAASLVLEKEPRDKEDNQYQALILSALVFVIITLFLNIIFQFIVYRAFEFLKKERARRLPTTMPNKSRVKF
ncbi:hypothetical protein AAVH_33191 [Aphelenchoides avenae]|nr:hypothetical protein AAVH_33191 [Aphelenchus avenae]